MRFHKNILALTFLGFAGCGGRDADPVPVPPPVVEEVAKAPQPPPDPIEPRAEFDPQDRMRSFLWIKQEATALQTEFKPAEQAVKDNPLNDDLLKEFVANKLPPYREKIQGIVGREISWKVVVNGVSEAGVYFWGDESFMTEPYIFNDNRDKAGIQIRLFAVNDNVNEKIRAERSTLRLGTQVSRDFSKTLKYADTVTVRGKIEKVDLLYGEKKPPYMVEIYIGGATSNSR